MGLIHEPKVWFELCDCDPTLPPHGYIRVRDFDKRSPVCFSIQMAEKLLEDVEEHIELTSDDKEKLFSYMETLGFPYELQEHDKKILGLEGVVMQIVVMVPAPDDDEASDFGLDTDLPCNQGLNVKN